MKRLSAVVPNDEYDRVERLVRAGAARSVAQLVREAVADYVNKLDAGRLINLRDVTLEQARKEVEEYLSSHPGVVWPDEVAEEIGIDYRIVLSVVRDLLREGWVEEAEEKVVHA